MSKIILKNITRGWFSIALRVGLSVELKPDDIYVIPEATKSDLYYYNQFIPLGISVTWKESNKSSQECLNEPLNEIVDDVKGLAEDNTEKDFTKYDELDVADDLSDYERPDNTNVSTEEDLDSYTKNEIRDILTKSNISWSKKATKAELIDLLRGVN